MANEIGHITGEINEYEHRHGRPMLSAVVVTKDTGMPGGGFFVLASSLGKFNGDSEQEKRTFLESELEEVYNTWD